MTFKESLIEYLTSNGMFDGQADDVVFIMQADPASAAMRGRWNDHIEGYPTAMLAVLRMAAKRVALNYIDTCLPRAWFRPMFTDDPDAEIARLAAESGK